MKEVVRERGKKIFLVSGITAETKGLQLYPG
jgi:hypothetical protein